MTNRIFVYFLIKSKVRITIIFLGFLFLSPNIIGQDVQFTMFNSHPLLLNPANTGNFEGDWRIAGNFRNQWAATTSPFRTASVHGDTKFYLFNQKIGAGLYFLNDESGVGGLTFNKLYASLAYEYNFRENYFSLGLQGGFVSGSVNSWSNWNHSTGSFDAPSGEENFNEKTNYFDFNVGLTWRRNIGIFEPNAGITFYHLNKPKKSFFNGDEKEEIQLVFHADVIIKLNDEYYLQPAILLKGKGGSSQSIIGTNGGYRFLGNSTSVKRVFAGIYLKNGLLSEVDALSILAGTTVKRMDIALCYDFNISSLGNASGKMMGAFEISFIYKSISTVLNSYSIPCERY